MNKKIPRKIHIIGSVGSGKTTMAKNLSASLNLPHYELDNVVWQREKTGDIRRSEDERNEYLGTILESASWVIEGVHYGWVKDSFDNADVIILLDPPYRRRLYRITRRFILQNLGMEKANYKPSFSMFRKMFEWNRNFEEKNRKEILAILCDYKEKLVLIRDARELRDNDNWRF
ncbi:AAA family ATPase [Mesobacillus subterraneus]|uniref:DNA topology modulation protein FlaR n=1 Tax=Mesobacillus subterraneus TaxID=285983 RepID=A0A427TQV9_9BACI|nr:AAA family ATPase [Mesobacillus subterraneus]RSD26651.1 DNA topology modulation protein FlaR [Mesobacillus subterraneus]